MTVNPPARPSTAPQPSRFGLFAIDVLSKAVAFGVFEVLKRVVEAHT